MPADEFDLIERLLARLPTSHAQVIVPAGDDAAVCRTSSFLATTMDTLVADVHFAADDDAADVGHKALAVNLSDLAAMAARPRWVLLALTLPQADTDWLDGFSQGFGELAQAHQVAVAGGDLTRGPLSIAVQASGEVASPLTRRGACQGDDIWVSGTVGDAAAALDPQARGHLDETAMAFCRQRLFRPTPRVELALAARPWLTAGIDLSDGLAQDLGHLAKASGSLGYRIDLDTLPTSAALACLPPSQRWPLQLCVGDDYELLVTADPGCRTQLEKLDFTRIGTMVADGEQTIVRPDGGTLELPVAGHAHFR